MAINFKKLKIAKGKNKSVVFGYIRNCQSLLPQNNSHYNISKLIYFICYAFCRKTEYFTKHGKNMKLNDKYDTLSNINSSESTAYGNIDIDCNNDKNIVYLWTLKVVSFSTIQPVLIIGIDSSKRMHINQRFTALTNKHSYHALVFFDFGIGKITKKMKNDNNPITAYVSSTTIKKNDIIKMELNCCSKKLKFWYNDQMLDNSIIDIDVGNDNVYHMAISSFNQENSIQIISFTYHHLSKCILALHRF